MSRSLFACLASALLFTGCGPEIPVANIKEYTPWDPEIVELFGKLPVQDDGRIKPLETVARFRLYRINGKRSLTFGVKDGDEVRKVKLDAVEWYLDCLFRPELAENLPFIMVDNVDVVIDIGIAPHESASGAAVLRSRYSLAELRPAMPDPSDPAKRGRLSEKRDEYLALKEKDSKLFDRDLKKQQLVDLHDRVAVLNYLLHMADFARSGLVGDVSMGKISPKLDDPAAAGSPFSAWLEKWREIPAAAIAEGQFDQASVEGLMRQLQGELKRLAGIAGSDPEHPIAGIAMFAPDDPGVRDWTTVGEEILKTVSEEEPYPQGIERVRLFEKLAASTADQAAFKAALKPFVEESVERAQARGEFREVPLERAYYRANFIANAMPFFILGFVISAFSWLAPGNLVGRVLGWGSVMSCVVGWVFVVGAIVMRCMIMRRPPISTLYETILFITAAAVLLCLVLEYFDRRKVAVAMAAVLGAAGMFLSLRYEMKEALSGKGDTMVTLEAVLRSNFWLGTHVIIINLGYAAGLLAAGLAVVYIGSRVFRAITSLGQGGRSDSDLERSVTRMVYGIVCFTLVFSLVGTVLGGVWANDSWGRFWGWDPKENGALMIVLWSLVILHARMGGYFKRLSLHAATVLLGMITVFSWWGVNELDIGLHSYGRTSGVGLILDRVYLGGWVIIGICGLVWMVEFMAPRRGAPQSGGGERTPPPIRKVPGEAG